MSDSNFVERFCLKYFQKNLKKSKEEILKNLSHLYLNGRKIEEIVGNTISIFQILVIMMLPYFPLF